MRTKDTLLEMNDIAILYQYLYMDEKHNITFNVPSQQKWTQKSFKKRNESQYFVNLLKPTAFIPRFAWQRASAGMMYRRKNEVAQGQFAQAQAYHTGYSLSSNFRGINAK